MVSEVHPELAALLREEEADRVSGLVDTSILHRQQSKVSPALPRFHLGSWVLLVIFSPETGESGFR